jgi:TolB-like protein
MRSFLQELRRRNVYKVGVMYAVGGWLLVQVATSVLPLFEVSPLTLKLVVLVSRPVSRSRCVLPGSTSDAEGIVKDQRGCAARIDRAPHRAATQLRDHRRAGARRRVPAGAALVAAAQGGPAAAAISDKSVAVLPFANLSEEKANAFFAEGIQDEILTRLAKIGALKVISRTSTQHYASSPDNLPEIARQLGVAHILEGSVQKVGDVVHINVQLIRAATDDHLWAEVYNRKLDDIFEVEAKWRARSPRRSTPS